MKVTLLMLFMTVKDAIDNLKKRYYDVLLLDLEMREVHGEKVFSLC